MRPVDASESVLVRCQEQVVLANGDSAIRKLDDVETRIAASYFKAHVPVGRSNKCLKYAVPHLYGDDDLLSLASKEFKSDKRKMMHAVQFNGQALRFAEPCLREDKDVVMLAVGNCGSALKFANKLLRQDGLVVKTAVKNDGMSLEFASKELKNCMDVVSIAVKQNSQSIQFASEKLQKLLARRNN